MFQSTRPRGARLVPIEQAHPSMRFQSTRPRGARRANRRLRFKLTEFQSTRPRGARPMLFPLAPCARHVSIHAPAWGATRFSRVGEGSSEFQSTRPRGARRWLCRWMAMPYRFNPRARVGRDEEAVEASLGGIVSIHAPAWGATWLNQECQTHGSCFNPRARVGRDLGSPSFLSQSVRFQSTRPRGARPGFELVDQLLGDVSIHAPAWGATGHNDVMSYLISVSIHAPAWGATIREITVNDGQRFQSTRPRGARLSEDNASCGFNMFQSTRPRGARPNSTADIRLYNLFQSTRPRGARPMIRFDPNSMGVFQSTRPRGARLICCQAVLVLIRFQSTRPRGARRRKGLTHWLVFMFQSTRPRGARQIIVRCVSVSKWFQSTRPRGARPRCRVAPE